MKRFAFPEWAKKLNFWDALVITVGFIIVILLGFSIYSKATELPSKPIRIFVKAGNLYKEIVNSVQVGDFVLDRDGRPFFKIDQVTIRPSRQAVVAWNGAMISADNPEMWTIEFYATSVNPKFKGSNLFYNWELVKPGNTMLMETNKTGFMATIIQVGEEK